MNPSSKRLYIAITRNITKQQYFRKKKKPVACLMFFLPLLQDRNASSQYSFFRIHLQATYQSQIVQYLIPNGISMAHFSFIRESLYFLGLIIISKEVMLFYCGNEQNSS